MKRVFKALLIVVVIFSFMPAFGQKKPNTPRKPPAKAAPPPETNEEYYDLLILGLDKRPHEKNGRSDVIMIIHFEPNRVTMFSIPRDTVAPIGHTKDKINAAYSWGAIDLAKKTIENFLKFKVDNYLVIDFVTFMKTIDVIKKLTDDGRLIGAENFLISGENLLKWLRWRNLPAGDRRRAQRHQLFMKRVIEFARNTYAHQPALFGQCVKAGLKVVNTDLTYDHVAQLFETYKNLNMEKDLERYVLPGYGKAYYESTDVTGEQRLTGWYYYEKYNWSLETYIKWYRKYNLQMNYVEEDVLRK